MENKNEEIIKISEKLESLRFRKKFFGGVSEQDVWKKINELNDMYEAALEAERIRYEILIENYKLKEREKQDGEMSYVD